MGIETDTSRSKFGDGTTAWASLSYTVGDSSGVGTIDWTSVLNKPTEFNPEPHAADHELGGSDELELDPTQITGTAIVEGDARLTDARTPTAHTHVKADITDFAHTHVVADITDFDPATKQDTITGAASTITSSNLTASRAVVSDGSGKVASSATTAAELGHVSGVTSAIQTQLNGKQATITGGATTITGSNLTASRALISDGSGKVAVSAVTSTQLGFVSGVTSAIQTQLNGKVNTVNGTVTTAATGSTVVRNITLSTANPSGGTDGQVWLKYT
jgi:uncharacterized membrane protein YdcZ (DUF606 family)